MKDTKFYIQFLLPLLLIMMFLGEKVVIAGNIDPGNDGSSYAWGENVGWINFNPSQGPGVTVTSTGLTGYAWGENIGWINLSPPGGGVSNDGAGNLSGFAWGENIGWINFAGVKINPTTGIFSGRAWGENIGWINFSIPNGAVKTSWMVKTGTTTTLQSNLNPSTFDQSVTFTATVTPSAATGTVAFKEGTTILGNGTLSGGTASYSTASLAADSHSITAEYGGDSNYNGSTSPALTQTVNKATPTITWANPADIVYGTPLSATQLNATASIAGSFVYTPVSGAVLNAGSGQNLRADFTPTDMANYSTATRTVQINVLKAATTTAVSSSVNPSTYGQSVTFTATVSPGSATGTVTFKDGTTTLGTGTLSGGTASYSTASLAAGSHFIAAEYAGDSNFNSSTSSALTQTVNPTQYTLTVTKAGTGTGTVTSSPSGINCGADCNEIYDSATVVTLTASANTGSAFSTWSGDLTGNVNPSSITMSGNKNVTATFTDTQPPFTADKSPLPGATNAPIDTNIVLHVKDLGSGVNQNTIVMTVEGVTVTPTITGTPADYTLTYDPPTNFGYQQQVDVTVRASDLAGNAMPQDSYSFMTISQSGNPWLEQDDDGDGILNGVEQNLFGTNPSVRTLFVKPMKEKEKVDGTAIFPPEYEYWAEFYTFLPEIKAVFARVNIEVVAIGDPNNPYLPMRDWNYNPATDPNKGTWDVRCDIMEIVSKASKEYVASAVYDHNHGHTYFGNGTWQFDSIGLTSANQGPYLYRTPKIYLFPIENYFKEGAYQNIAGGQTPVPAASCSTSECCDLSPNSPTLMQYYNYCNCSPMNLKDGESGPPYTQHPDGTVEMNQIIFNSTTQAITDIIALGNKYDRNRVKTRTIIHEMGHGLLSGSNSDDCEDPQCIMNPNPPDWELYDLGHGTCKHMPGGNKNIWGDGIIRNTAH